MTAPALPVAYRRVVASVGLMNLADGIRMAAMPLLAASLTGSALLVAVVLGAGQVPWLLLGIWAGGLADRTDAVLLARRVALVRAGLLVLLAALIVANAVPIPLLIIASFVLGISEVLADSSTGVLVPSLVSQDQLERANSQMVAASIFGNELAGPAIGGALFVMGAAIPFLSNGALLATAFVLLAGLPLIGANQGDRVLDTESVQGGLELVRSSPTLVAITVSSSVLAAIDGAWFTILVLFVQNDLGLSDAAFGAFLALGALGGFAGAGLANWKPGLRLSVVAIVVVSSMGASLVWLGLFPSPTVTAIVLIVTSAGFALWNIFAVSARQRATPESMYGRVAGAYRTVVISAGIGGTLIGGLVADLASIQATLIAGGLLLVALSPIAALTFRKLES